MFFEKTKLSTGTAFFYRHLSGVFLVTNWHNVSGKNPFTGKHLPGNSGEPNSIEFLTFEAAGQNNRLVQKIEIERSEGSRSPWFVHPSHGNRVDLVAIMVQSSFEEQAGGSKYFYCINSLAKEKNVVKIGADVFILGHPEGINVHNFPIWKRGSIASEPSINAGELPYIYVDTATCAGLSGSPVLVRGSNGQMENGDIVFSGQAMDRFFGIYSGRVGVAGQGLAQLGIVWRMELIDEIINGAKTESLCPFT